MTAFITTVTGEVNVAFSPGIDRSIEAWTLLMLFIPATEDELINRTPRFITKHRPMGEAEFPNAGKFIRPGFDEQ